MGRRAWSDEHPPRARAREGQPRAVPRAGSARGRQARAGDGDAVDIARRRAHARAGPGRRGRRTSSCARACRAHPEENLAARRVARLPREHRMGWPAAAAEHPQADPRGSRVGRRLCGRSRRAATGQARLRAGRSRSSCSSWAQIWAPTSPRRSHPDAGWPRVRASGCTSFRIRAVHLGCSCCRCRWGCRPRRCMPRPTGSACARAQRELDDRRSQLRVALELGAPLPAASSAVAQRPPAGRDLAVSGDRRGAEGGARKLGRRMAFVSGSGPTVVGLFPRANAARAGRARRCRAHGPRPAPIPATLGGCRVRAGGDGLLRLAGTTDVTVRHNHDRETE